MKLIQKPERTWRKFNDKDKKRGVNGRPSRLPVGMNNEEFAKAVDHALRDLDDDLEEAQRRIRNIAEKIYKNASTVTRRKTDRNGKKTTQNVSKKTRKSDNKRLLCRNKNKMKKRVGDTEAYVHETEKPQDKYLQNGGTTVSMI